MTVALVKRDLVKLNLGCGADIRKDCVNVDTHCGEVRLDLNSTGWPWADNSVGEVVMFHVLEHLPDTIQVMKELYRVCCDGAKVFIKVPHPRHDDFLSDPTHVRPITIRLLHLFSKKQCAQWASAGNANTPIATIHNVDFEVIDECYGVDAGWMEKVKRGEITDQQLKEMAMAYNNVIREIEVTLKVCK